MAFAFTVTGVNTEGNLRSVYGTFTSAAGDKTATLSATTHNLNNIMDYSIKLDSGGIGAQSPKVTISNGTITALWQDTQGYSGKFYVKGN